MGIAVSPQIHPRVAEFIDKPRKMLINGKWTSAASGKNFPTYNPATGEVLAQVAEGDREDIDRAAQCVVSRVLDVPICSSNIRKSLVTSKVSTTASRSISLKPPTSLSRSTYSVTWLDGQPRSKATRFHSRFRTHRVQSISLTRCANRSESSDKSFHGTNPFRWRRGS